MAIAPNHDCLESAPAAPVAGSSLADQRAADQLLADVRAKVALQLNKTTGPVAFQSQSPDSQSPDSQSPDSQSQISHPSSLRPLPSQAAPAPSQTRSLIESPQPAGLDQPLRNQKPGKRPLSVQPDAPTFEAPTFEAPTFEALEAQQTAETLDVQKMAAEGYFQAIAYWLNAHLVPQNLYAKVLADEVAGRIKVLVEFERSPQPKRLVRYICDRIYRLNSNVIEGVRILARPIGASKTSWEKSVRIPTASERSSQNVAPKVAFSKQENSPPSAAAIAATPDSVPTTRTPFTAFRAALVCGSAFLALLISSFLYLLISDQLSMATASQPAETTVPWYGQTNEPDIFRSAIRSAERTQTGSQATAISFRPASRFRDRTVEAAFETVAVIPHQAVADPSDPTVTLMFGGELAFDNFVFEDTADLDTLFSEINVYEQADFAMVSLAEPLAYASTSLQEDFYQRTRPQAARSLKSGGIDIVGIAGDGSMTHGSRGLSETLGNLDRQGIYRVGAGRNQQEAHRPEILEVKGQRIAYLGYSSDAVKLAEKEKAGVALNRTAEHSYITQDIEAIRDQVDWIVVNYRWGETAAGQTQADDATDSTDQSETAETELTAASQVSAAQAPEEWQKVLAREAVDAGADIVVGTHPSHIQGIEVYRDRPIAYSLGNFAFSRNPETDSLAARDTAALRVSLRNQRMKVELLPVTLDDSKLQRASGEQGTRLLQSIRNASKHLDQPLLFPAVLSPDPPAINTAPAVDSAADESSEPAAIPVPEVPHAIPGIVETISPEAGIEDFDEPYTPPSPDPMMQESDALFMPETDMPEAGMPETNTSEADVPEANISADEAPTDALPLESPSDNSIRPYAEPLVGPLSSLSILTAPNL